MKLTTFSDIPGILSTYFGHFQQVAELVRNARNSKYFTVFTQIIGGIFSQYRFFKYHCENSLRISDRYYLDLSRDLWGYPKKSLKSNQFLFLNLYRTHGNNFCKLLERVLLDIGEIFSLKLIFGLLERCLADSGWSQQNS